MGVGHTVALGQPKVGNLKEQSKGSMSALKGARRGYGISPSAITDGGSPTQHML